MTDLAESPVAALDRPTLEEELHQLLLTAQSKTGEVYRLHIQGLSPGEISYELRMATSNVALHLARCRIILTGPSATEAPTNINLVKMTLGRLLRSTGITPTVRKHLKGVLDQCNSVVVGTTAAVEEEDEELAEESEELTRKLEIRQATGVYVWSSPLYRNAGWYKVGQTSGASWARVRDSARMAGGYPDGVEIYRVYVTDEPLALEQRFHRFLTVADHERSDVETAGTEWFKTNLDFLDEIARAFGVEILTA